MMNLPRRMVPHYQQPSKVNVIARHFINTQGFGDCPGCPGRFIFRTEDKYYRPAAIPLDTGEACPITLGQVILDDFQSCLQNKWIILIMGFIFVLGMFLQHKLKLFKFF